MSLGFLLRPKGYTRWRIRRRLEWRHIGHPYEVKESERGTAINCLRCNVLVGAVVGLGGVLQLTCTKCGTSVEVKPSRVRQGKIIFDCVCGETTELTERTPR